MTPLLVELEARGIIDDLAGLLTRRSVTVTTTHGYPDHISGAPEIAAFYAAQIHDRPTSRLSNRVTR